MSMTRATSPFADAPIAGPLGAALWPAEDRGLIRALTLIAAGVCVITLGAKAQIPFWPVPMTLQTLAVSVIAAAYGFRLGVATVVAYLALGFLGAPVFAGAGAGPVYMAGPTAGFLAGFVLMAAIIGAAADRGLDRRLLTAAAAMAIGNVIVFAPGLLWLGQFTGYGARMFAVGFEPFVFATLVKTALAAALMPAAWALMRRFG